VLGREVINKGDIDRGRERERERAGDAVIPFTLNDDRRPITPTDWSDEVAEARASLSIRISTIFHVAAARTNRIAGFNGARNGKEAQAVKVEIIQSSPYTRECC